jgi:uncharacterized membrane protein
MGRKARAKKSSPDSQPAIRQSARRQPNWPLVVLSTIGILLTSYILWTDYLGNQLRGCSIGSACDIVLSSRWARLMGAPTAFWGFATYVTLALLAARWHAGRWRMAWAISIFGLCYSAYLTIVSLTILNAACPYCLTSLALMTTIAAVTTFQRPDLPSLSFVRTAGYVFGAAAAFILVAHLNYTGVLGEPPSVEDPKARALAIHLSRSGAKMYGASWCPHCQEQKELFGLAASRLPYVECSTGPQGSPQTAICRSLNIMIYPTWIIDGKRTEEVMTFQQLAEATGFREDAVEGATRP